MPAHSMYGSVYGRSVAGSVYGGGSVWSDASIGSIGHMLHAADLQQRRSIKMFHNVARLAELEADRQLHHAEKAAAREAKLAAFESIREEEKRQAATEAVAMEEHRRARAEAAARDEAAVRQAALRKVQSVEERAEEIERERAAQARHNAKQAAERAAKRQAAYEAALEAEEAKRASFKARQDAQDRIMHEREELKRLELSIREEQAFLRQEARAAAKGRAEAEEAQRVSVYRRKVQNKEAVLETFHKQAGQVRRLKAREGRARAEYITMQASIAAEADAARRAQIRAIASSKAARVEAIVSEREALAERLQRIRYSMVRQEQAVRCSLDALRRQGKPFNGSSIADGASIVDGYAPSLAGTMFTTRSRLAQSVASNHGGRAGSVRSGRPASAAAARKQMGAPVTGPGGDQAEYKRVRPMSASAVLRAGAAAAAMAGMPTEAPEAAGGLPLGPRIGKAAVGYSTIGVPPASPVVQREEELRNVLREEIDKETERQAILAGTPDSKEAHRLAVIFAAERDSAKRRILELSAAVHAATRNTATLNPRPVAPGETGQPTSSTFLTPSTAAAAYPSTPSPAGASRAPISSQAMQAMHSGLPGAGVVVHTGFHHVYTEPAVAIPAFSIPSVQMLQPVQPHHHHMASVQRCVPVV